MAKRKLRREEVLRHWPQRSACAEAFGSCAARHLTLVLDKLENLLVRKFNAKGQSFSNIAKNKSWQYYFYSYYFNFNATQYFVIPSILLNEDLDKNILKP